MARIERSIEAKAPVEKVWAFMSDLEKWPTFMKDIKKVEYLTEKRSGIGAKTHFVVESSGQQIEWEADFTEWVEKKVAWRSTSGLKNNGYRSLEPTQIGTRITFMMDYELPDWVLGKIIDRLKVEKDFTKSVDESMEAAKRILEG